MAEAPVVTLVLVAAVLHASWNALVKQSGERLLTFAIVVGTTAGLFVPVAVTVGLPASASLPFIAGSATIHLGYYAFLLLGYQTGDLSLVYPIARGLAPLLLAVGSVLLVHEALGSLGMVGVVLVSLGIASLAPNAVYRSLMRWSFRIQSGTPAPVDRAPLAVGFALATGVCIAGYMLCDGLGVRASHNFLAYIAAQNIAAGAPFALAVLIVRRKRLVSFLAEHGWRAALGGMASAPAYAIVVWAMSVSRLAYVAALRETSVIVATLIGARLLKEPFGGRRVAAACAVALGIVLMSVG